MKSLLQNELFKVCKNRLFKGVFIGIFIYNFLIEIIMPNPSIDGRLCAVNFFSYDHFGMLLFWLVAVLIAEIVCADNDYGTENNAIAVGVNRNKLFLAKGVVSYIIPILISTELFVSSFFPRLLYDSKANESRDVNTVGNYLFLFVLFALIIAAECEIFSVIGLVLRTRIISLVSMIVISLISSIFIGMRDRYTESIFSPFGILLYVRDTVGKDDSMKYIYRLGPVLLAWIAVIWLAKYLIIKCRK